MKHRSALWIATLLLAAGAGASASAEHYAGLWNRVSSTTTVKVISWGENCGPEPKSYANNKVAEVEIVAQGSHLVFTKGGIRTDRCSSANPRLITKSEKVTGSRWERVCETAPSDSKYERDEYLYVAHGDNRIEYRAKSNYDWTLKGDHCVLVLEERRVFERVGAAPAPKEEPAPEQPAPEPAVAPEPAAPDGPAAPECARDGEMRRLSIFPREAEIGPGERICFKAHGTDPAGCRFAAEAVWTAQQNGVEVGGLLTRGGCFQAGATAAESEGTYEVIAQAEGKRATASVTVVFQDLSDLLGARLAPSQEPGAVAQPAAQAVSAQAAPPAPAPAGSGAPVVVIAVVSVVVLLAAGVVVLVLVLRRRASAARLGEEDLADGSLERPARAGGGAAAAARREEPAQVRCPKCNEAFPAGARFCPNDGSPLSAPRPAGAEPPSSVPPDAPGMVCPKCHRGYGADARFCPHDSARLMPYPEWRASRRAMR